jgi:superkiller protein 3
MNASQRCAAALFLLAAASPLLAQSTAVPLRATGDHQIAAGETAERARAEATTDAYRRLWQSAVSRLQSQPGIKALALEPNALEAYTAALLDVPEPPAPAAAGGAKAVQVTLDTSLDLTELTSRIAALTRDQDAAFDIRAAWADMQKLHGAPFSARLLTARASAATARTQPATVGGRAAAPEGRKQARMLVDSALALAPDASFVHFANGDLLLAENQPDRAEAAYQRALSTQADFGEGHRRLAEALRQQAKVDEAVAALQEAIRLDARSARAHNDLAFILENNRGQMKEALAEYQAAVAIDRDLIDAHNGMAISLARQGRLPDAVAEFREMIRIDPDSAQAYYNLASALADMDQDAEASAALREVIRINPNHYNAHYNLGEMFRLEGKYEDAAKQFREYLRLAPADTPANRRNIERAKSLVQKFEEQP